MVDHGPEFRGANLESQATLEAKAAATSGPARKHGQCSLNPGPIGCTLIGLLPPSGCPDSWHLTSDQVARILENLTLLFEQPRILLSLPGHRGWSMSHFGVSFKLISTSHLLRNGVGDDLQTARHPWWPPSKPPTIAELRWKSSALICPDPANVVCHWLFFGSRTVWVLLASASHNPVCSLNPGNVCGADGVQSPNSISFMKFMYLNCRLAMLHPSRFTALTTLSGPPVDLASPIHTPHAKSGILQSHAAMPQPCPRP